MTRAERRRIARGTARQVTRQLSAHVAVEQRRIWAITLAAWIAGARLVPGRLRAQVCTRLVRLAQYRVNRGPWQCMPIKVTP